MFSSKRVAQHRVVGGLADDRGHPLQPDPLRGPPPPLAHDELEAACRGLADDDRLQQAELADRVLQLAQRLVVELRARLLRVGDDRVDLDLAQLGGERGPVAESRAGRRGWGGSANDAGVPMRTDTSTPSSGRVGISAASPRPSPPLRCGTPRSFIAG